MHRCRRRGNYEAGTTDIRPSEHPHSKNRKTAEVRGQGGFETRFTHRTELLSGSVYRAVRRQSVRGSACGVRVRGE